MIRAQTRFGTFMLGPMPRVVGCISQIDALNRLATGSARDCDILELRLDLLGGDPAKHLQLVDQLAPTIGTIRLASEGGGWKAADSDRLPLFAAALRHCTAIDIELRSPLLKQVSALAVKHQKALIISYHDFESTPPLAELQQVMRKGANYGTVIKIATFAQNAGDLATLRALFQENCSAALCVLGMGPLARQTRLEFPKLGSCLSYGYWDKPIAPGQPSARELMQELHAI